MRQCKVFVQDQEAGLLQETDQGEYVFTYNEEYDGIPVCLAMPVRSEAYRCDFLFPYFFNMLSEGVNRQIQATMFHLDENDHFGILLSTAQNDTIGAVTVKPI